MSKIVEYRRLKVALCETSNAQRLFFQRTVEHGEWVTDANPLQTEGVFQRRWDHVRGFDHEGEYVI